MEVLSIFMKIINISNLQLTPSNRLQKTNNRTVNIECNYAIEIRKMKKATRLLNNNIL